MNDLSADAKYGVRLLRKSPGFAAAAVATLALAIGATTAMFSIVDGVLLKPLPVKDQNRLLVVWTSVPQRGFEHWPFSYTSYLGIRERLRTVSGAAAQPYSGTLPAVLHLDDASAMPLQRTAVTGGWFDVLGVHARAGRLLTEADDRAGAPRVVVLSGGMAKRLFGGAEAAIGRTLHLDEDSYTIVGVTPIEFDYPRGAEAWVAAVWFRDSPYVDWDMVVRIAPGFAAEQTIADLDNAMRTLPPEPLGPLFRNRSVHARTLTDDIVGDVRRPILILGGVVLLMLIVAGVNVANLQIARTLARRRELSIRAAIGASRGRLVRHLAVESFVLTCFGAAAAVFIAKVVLDGILALAPPELPRIAQIAIDGRALGFTAIVAAFVVVAFGALPAISSARNEPAEALRSSDGNVGGTSRRQWLRRALVIVQVATTVLVMSAAGLLLRSLDRLQHLDIGFASEGLFLAEIALPASRYPAPPDIQRAMIALAEQVTIAPGVTRATVVATPPFAGTQGVDAVVFAEGQDIREGATPVVNYEGVDASYFGTLGVPILRGRGIDARDRAGSAPVVVVSETFGRLFWPGKDPLGRRLKWGSSTDNSPWLTVVGIARDTRYRELAVIRPTMYVPYAHGIPVSPAYLAIRSRDASLAAGGVRSALANREPGGVLVTVDRLPYLLAAPLSRPRFQTMLAGCFAALVLGLSLIGTYGLLSFIVRQRRREIGIRIALGATPWRVRQLVLREGVTIAAAGILIGVALALRIGLLIQPLLFGVSTADPLVLIGTAALLVITLVGATMVPTRQAARTDPMEILRSE